jgi:predicted permease
METLMQDVRFGLRVLRRSPGFTAIAVLTLGLGIGANTGLFSVVNAVLLNPLPFPQPNQLVGLHENKPNFEGGSISYPNFLDWQKENRTFSSMAIARRYAFSLTDTGEPEQVSAEFITPEFLPLLGLKPRLGRTFIYEDDQPGAAPVALISEGFWKRKLGSAHDVLGRALRLNGRNFTIIGVLPATHLLLPSFRDSDIYAPINQWNNSLLHNRGAGLGIHGIGRLRPGVTVEQARADMQRVTRNLAAAYPDENKDITAKVTPLKEEMVGYVRPLLLLLLGAVGFVLLIACVNIANLLLARATGRTREFAIRNALGAGQVRLVRQLLTESVLLVVAGAALGLLFATWGTRAALGILPSTLPRAESINLDGRVLLFTTAVSVLAGILFGLTPALKMSRLHVQSALQENGIGLGKSSHRIQGVFVVVEMALALVLLCGAGLMIRSLVGLWGVSPGFNPHNVLNFGISLPPSMLNASSDAIRSAFRQVDDKIAAIPGVTAVSQTWESLPMAGDDEQLFWLEGQPKPSSQNDMNWAIHYVVGPDYLKVMQIPLRQGRFLTHQDDEHSLPVTVVDDVFAIKYFPNQDPVGKRIHLNGRDGLTEIVGVVGHVKQWGLEADDTESLRAQLYIPWMQMPDEYIAMTPSGAGMVVRSAGSEAGLFDSVRRASTQMSSQQVIFGAQKIDQLIADSLARQRFSMILLVVFAALALGLAMVGIYGVISFVVGQSTREIGIRMAMGAQRQEVLGLILKRGGKLTLIGVGLGLGAAIGLTRLMSNLLYGVGARDPLTLVAVAAVLITAGLGGCYVPARRAARVEPMVALRYE